MTDSYKIGKTEISIIRENTFGIESTNLILDSIHDNMTQIHNKYIKKISQSHPVKKTNVSSSSTSTAKIEFHATSVMPLSKFLNKKENKHGLDFNTMLHFIGNIGNQLTHFKNNGYSIPFFSLDDIIVIDEVIFAFINTDKIFKIDTKNNNNITIDYPISYDASNSFIPPGIGFDNPKESKLPIDVHFSSAHYSLAQLCIFIFLKQKIKNEADYDEVSGSFIYTSFYWCLKRCLDKDENKRILLYV
jgi:hypothetical protein